MRNSKIFLQMFVFLILLNLPSYSQASSSNVIRLQKELLNEITIYPGRIIDLEKETLFPKQRVVRFFTSENREISISILSDPIVVRDRILGVSGFRTAKEKGVLEIRLSNDTEIQCERRKLIEKGLIGVLTVQNKVFGIAVEKDDKLFGSWYFYVHFSDDSLKYLPLFFDPSIFEPVIINILNKG